MATIHREHNFVAGLARGAGLIVVFLRRELIALLKRIAEISLPGGYKVIFDKSLAQSSAALANIPVIERKPEFKGRHATTDEAFTLLLESEPRDRLGLMSQMLNAYSYLLELLLEVREVIGRPDIGNPAAVVQELAKQMLVTQEFVTAFENIRMARNALIHLKESEIDAEEATNFVGQVMRLTEYLELLKDRKDPPKRG